MNRLWRIVSAFVALSLLVAGAGAVLSVGARGAVASDGPSVDEFLELQARVDALEQRVHELDGQAPPDHDHEPPDEEPGDPGDDDDGGTEPEDPEEPAEPEDPDAPADDVDADVVLSGDYPDGITVEAGQTALVDGLVTTPKNVVVHGTLAMRSGAHLKFRDVDVDAYVGANTHDHSGISESDIGLWVTDSGALDLVGTPKQGWNRTGQHETWAADDEYWISPTDPGDFDPRPWNPGDPIPRYDPRVPAAEVINVTRDVVIEGPAHIFVQSDQPQRIEYVQLRSMGVSNAAHEGPVLGRYALHLHYSQDGSRGTVINGVASIDAQGRVFVPHASHGITMTDVVSVNSYAEALWWDKGDSTHDLVVDGFAASGVHMPEEVAGSRRDLAVAVLGSNRNAVIRNSAVSGSRGRDRALGFHWNTSGAHREDAKAVWDFHDNVTHNNEGHGLRFWFNDKWPHHVRDSATYNNGGFGIENGAYTNSIRYSDVLVIDNQDGGILHHSSSNVQSEDGGPSRYTNVTVDGPDPAIEIGRLRGTPNTRQEFIGCDLGGGQVVLDTTDKTAHPFIAVFRDCGKLSADDIVVGGKGVASGLNGSSIEIEPSDGRASEVVIDGGKRSVR